MPAPIAPVISQALCSVVRTQLPGALRELLQALELALGEQSLQAFSNREAEACNELRRVCRTHGRQAIEQVVARVCQYLPLGLGPQVEEEDNSSQWSLVDDAEVDDLLEAKRLVRSLRETLGPLEWRACSCLNRLSDLQPREGDHPLSLEFLLRQLQEALQLRQQAPLARLVFQNSVQRVLSVALMGYLQALLQVLNQHQVEPLQPSPSHQPLQRQMAVPQRQAARARPYQAFHELRQAQEGRQAQSGRQVYSQAGSDISPGAAGQVDSALTEALAGGEPALPLTAGFAGMQRPPVGEHWAASQWLHELERQGCAISPRQREDALLVGELFDALDQEERLAAGLKPALRSLLPTVLQAALIDPAAFADPAHPLRSTLDKVLRLADACDPPNRALEARVQGVIETLNASYQGDVAVFSAQAPALDELLALQQRAYRHSAERVMQAHRGRDTLEDARRRVDAAMYGLHGGRAAQILLDWLAAGWKELLVHELIRNGEDSVGWRGDLALTSLLNRWLQRSEDLSALSEDDVERVYEIEHLLDILRRRMESFLVGQYQYQTVLASLRRQLLGEEPMEFVTVAPQVSAQPLVLDSTEQRWRERRDALQAGDWLRDAQGQALQLIWCNPAMDHYVLVDSQGREAGNLNGDQLLHALSSGSLLLSDAEAPVEGLIQSTLQDIVGRLYHEITHARSHDELTGLLNRRSFEVAVAQCLAGPLPHSFLLAHIDQFILLNQHAGPVAGDACLRQLAERLPQLLPGDASLSRFGGVDFAVALPGYDESQALALAERLRTEVESQGFVWEGHRHGLSLSIGVVEASSRHDVANVISDLQSASNSAKQEGRNRVHCYREAQDGEHSGLLAIGARVDDIVEREELSLRLQQIAPLAVDSHELPHYELLLVMENDLQLVDFIAAAERYQRMPKVDRWVLKRIFSELERHPQVWQHSSSISINLSGSSLNDDKLLGFIESLFEQHAVEPSRICFELTETAAVANLAKTADLVRHLQLAGCSFSIDDFGVGFSSFDYLKRLPVDYVKIDGSFVREIEHSASDLAMVRSINEIAHALGRKTIAEYVESASIRERLLELGVDYVQGYGVEKPRPLEQWLTQG